MPITPPSCLWGGYAAAPAHLYGTSLVVVSATNDFLHVGSEQDGLVRALLVENRQKQPTAHNPHPGEIIY